MSDAICAELLINVLDNSVSAVVTLVLNEPLSVCKFVMLVSSVVSRVDNDELKLVVEPEISDAICAEDETNVLDNSVSAVVILVEKLPLSVCKLSTFVSSVVILELNEPLSVCKFVILVSSVVSLVDKLLLKSLDEPEISDAICAELLISVFPNSLSAVVILVEKLPLSVCKFVILVSSVVRRVDNEPLKLVKEPLMSDEICAELLIKVFPNSLSAVVILVEKLPLSVCKFVILDSSVVNLVDKLLLSEFVEPLMSDAI